MNISLPPSLSLEIYQALPGILKQGTDMFERSTEKDVFLIGALTVLSSCLPNISGLYFNVPVTPHLYSFISAPAGSGKGKLTWAKFLGQQIHNEIVKESLQEKEDYLQELSDFHLLNKKDRMGNLPPEEPLFKTHFIPANSSASAFIKSLQANNNCGIIFETEADVLSNTFKQEWGSFSYILRDAFHHETASMNRKGELVELNDLHLAIVLSGTPNQLVRLLPSVEDGLFSRFMYYYFEDKQGFMNPFISYQNINYTEFFNELGNKTFDLYKHMKSQYKPFTFEFSHNQTIEFTNRFNQMLSKNQLLIGSDFNASVKRLGLIAFRIAMILSILRRHESKNYLNPIECSDTDFQIAIKLVGSLVQHAVYIFRTLPSNQLTGLKLQLYDNLPDNFNRQDYLKFAKELGIKDKAAEKYIKIMVDSSMLIHNHNDYSKVKL